MQQLARTRPCWHARDISQPECLSLPIEVLLHCRSRCLLKAAMPRSCGTCLIMLAMRTSQNFSSCLATCTPSLGAPSQPAHAPPGCRASAKGALRLRLQGLIAQHDAASGGGDSGRPGGPNVTKTSLSRLRVDELRAALEGENADARGNKDVLVQRLLALVQEEGEAEVLPVLEDVKEG